MTDADVTADSGMFASLDAVHDALLQHQHSIILERATRSIDTNTCTYARGYHRQPLYSCRTCASVSGRAVAVCMSCSIHCHSECEIEEVYDKRNMRCDCPTLTDAVSKCQLTVAATEVNDRNQYNHNYEARYCHCDTAYLPDQHNMFKCIACEDWFHSQCIATQPDAETSADADDGSDREESFFCRQCLSSEHLNFLLPYLYSERPISPLSTSPQSAVVVTGEQFAEPVVLDVDFDGWQCNQCRFINGRTKTVCFGCEALQPSAPSPPSSQSSAPSVTVTSQCHRPAANASIAPSDLFVYHPWRQSLCRCLQCLTLYQSQAPWILIDDAESTDSRSRVDEALTLQSRDSGEIINDWLESQPREAVLMGMERLNEWTELVMSNLSKFLEAEKAKGSEPVITAEVVHQIVRGVTAVLTSKRQRDFGDEMHNDAADDDEADVDDPSHKRARHE